MSIRKVVTYWRDKAGAEYYFRDHLYIRIWKFIIILELSND